MAVVSYSEFKNNPAGYFLAVFNIEALRKDYNELTAIAGFDCYWDGQVIKSNPVDITDKLFKGAATGWICYVPTGVRSLSIEHTTTWRYIADYDVVFDRTKLKDLNASVSVDELTTYLTERIEQPDTTSRNAAPKFKEFTTYNQLLVCRYVQCNKLPTPEMQKEQRERDLISLQSLELASVNTRELALKQLQAYDHFQNNAHNYICASFNVPIDTPDPIVPSGFDFKRVDKSYGGIVIFRFVATSKRQILVPYQLGNTTTSAVYQVELNPDKANQTILLADIKRSLTELTGLDDDLEAKFPDGALLDYPELKIEYVQSHKADQLPEHLKDLYQNLDTKGKQQKIINKFAIAEVEMEHKYINDKWQRQQQMRESRQKLNIDAYEFGLFPAEISEAALQPENEALADPDNITSAVTSIETVPVVEATVSLQAELPNETDQPQASETAVVKHQVKCLFPQNATVRYTAADAHNLSLIDYGPLIFDKLKAECPALADALAKDELSEVLYWDRYCLKLNELLQLSQLFVQLQKEPSFKQHTVSFFMSAAGKNKDEAAEFDRFSKMDVLQTLLKQQNFPIARLVVHAGFENKRHDRILQLIFVSGARFELNFSYGMAFFDVTLPDDMATAIAEVNNEKDAKKRKAMLGPMLAELQVDFRPLGVLGKSASMTIAVAGFSPVMPAAQQD